MNGHRNPETSTSATAGLSSKTWHVLRKDSSLEVKHVKRYFGSRRFRFFSAAILVRVDLCIPELAKASPHPHPHPHPTNLPLSKISKGSPRWNVVPPRAQRADLPYEVTRIASQTRISTPHTSPAPFPCKPKFSLTLTPPNRAPHTENGGLQSGSGSGSAHAQKKTTRRNSYSAN